MRTTGPAAMAVSAAAGAVVVLGGVALGAAAGAVLIAACVAGAAVVLVSDIRAAH